MSLAADPRYRVVTVSQTNNGGTGTETVQLLARPLGGAWTVVQQVPINGAAQSYAWSAALPVTQYDLAVRYLNGPSPAVGYENADPDLWTSPHAAGSKVTMQTTSAPVAWGSGIAFSTPGTPINLNWMSAQTEAPYLLEKSNDGGATWTTIAADLVATSYPYTVPPGELNTTVQFRVTAQRDAIVGPTAGVISVVMAVTLGTPDLVYMTSSDGTNNLTCYAVWHRALATDQVNFLQARAVGGITQDSPVVGCGAPAVEDVGAQPDGYVPVTAIPTPWATDTFTPWTLYVRASIDGITWGAWEQVTTFCWARSGDHPPAPVTTIGALSAAVTATQTVDAGFGPTHLRLGAIIFDVAGTWAMMRPRTPTGTHSFTLNFPPGWSGKTLYLTGWTMQDNPVIVPTALNGALAIGPARGVVGLVP